jgi:hypothetical protein
VLSDFFGSDLTHGTTGDRSGCSALSSFAHFEICTSRNGSIIFASLSTKGYHDFLSGDR